MSLDEKGGLASNDSVDRDPRLHDPPKPVARSNGPSELAQKIAQLSQNLATEGAGRADGGGGAARTAAPELITSGSLNEARAYIPDVATSAPEDPITIEMHRVRVADEVNAVTWVTERIERKPPLAGSEGALEAGAEGAPPTGEAAGGELDEGEMKWARSRARLRIGAALVAASFVLGVIGLVSFTLIWRPSRASALMTAHAGELFPPGLMDEVTALYEAASTLDKPAPAAPDRRRKAAAATSTPATEMALKRGVTRTGQRPGAGARRTTPPRADEAEPTKKKPPEELILQ